MSAWLYKFGVASVHRNSCIRHTLHKFITIPIRAQKRGLTEIMAEINMDSKNPPGVVLLAVEHLKKHGIDVPVNEGNKTFVKIGTEIMERENVVGRYLARQYPTAGLYGSTALESSQVDSWLDFSYLYLKNSTEISTSLDELNRSLTPANFLVGYNFTLADFAVWSALIGNSKWNNLLDSGKANTHVARWFNYCSKQDIFQAVQPKLQSKSANNTAEKKPEKNNKLKANMEDGGKFFDLPGAEKGKVVVRFPPEASGYLHIGHAKAALLNQYYKEHYDGKLVMRFDDTNPAKENAHFEQIILDDIKLLQLTPDFFTRTSDHFDVMFKYAEQMIKQGDAYVDDTPADEMKRTREEREPSVKRDLTVQENLRLFEEMKKGSALGLVNCLRAKIDYKSDNGCLRDPVMYRCRNEAHLMHGTKYKAYPTYDFACPIVDSIEGVTHALRTTEYLDRDHQYYWIVDKLGIRKPFIYSYSRLALINTVLSKRKLTYLVDEGFVEGWDDPRFPTVRGVIRRGMTIAGLKEFIVAQGSSKSNVHMEWDKIWSFNKKVIDPISPRYNALLKDEVVPVHINGVSESSAEYPKHPKNTDAGTKPVYYSNNVLIEGEDAKTMKEGDLVTFINWGNLRINKVNTTSDKVTSLEATPELDNKDFKKTLKITWLANHSEAPFVPTRCAFFDNIIEKADMTREDDFKQHINKNTKKEYEMLGDPVLNTLKKGDIIQLQRRGYFICDQPYSPLSRHSSRESPCMLFHIPDGSTAGMMNQGKDKVKTSTTSVKEKPAKAEKSKKQGRTPSASNATTTAVATKAPTGSLTPEQQTIFDNITKQGDKIRSLKAAKADKDSITAEVNLLKELKSKYKSLTGAEYKAPAVVATGSASQAKEASPSKKQKVEVSTTATVSHTAEQQTIFDNITKQGDKIRSLKAAKADKDSITKEVNILKELKTKYKSSTGVEYKAPTVVATGSASQAKQASPSKQQKASISTTAAVSHTAEQQGIFDSIVKQGNIIRELKSSGGAKDKVLAEVGILKNLKVQYKASTGQEFVNPTAAAPTQSKDKMAPVSTTTADATSLSAEGEAIKQKIVDQGEKIRQLKTSNTAKDALQPEINTLLKLKTEFKELTGTDYQAPGGASRGGSSKKGKADKKPKENKAKENKPKEVKKKQEEVDESGLKKVTRLGLEAKKEESLSDWYSQIITKSELIEYYDVSGCYILRPWAFSIWEKITAFFDAEIKKLGVENCYFPMFVSQAALEKEKDHIADFAPEVAWVTRSGNSELAEPIAVRPTSETVMYPAYAKWIQSHRDLPLKLNQWCNVVRWEFKHPQPFLRTREFLWQEGHTAYDNKEDACEEVYTILDLYARVYTDLLAIPVVKGRKTEKEKFAGGDFTTTIEAYIQASGRAIQGATSHHLGQNFSKMFDIAIEDPTKPDSKDKLFVYQNSWGLTTRTIGVLVMVHGDNKGLVLPPNAAGIQVVIVPVGITANTADVTRQLLKASAKEYEIALKKAGVRTRLDDRDNYSPGWKYNHWEVKGVPIRIELGPRDIAKGEFVAVRRDTGEKITMKKDTCESKLSELLETIQSDMFKRASKQLDDNLAVTTSWKEFLDMLDNNKIIQAPFCGNTPCEEKIKKDSAKEEVEAGAPSMGAKSLCIPFTQPGKIDGLTCVHPDCGQAAKFYTLFGRSY